MARKSKNREVPNPATNIRRFGRETKGASAVEFAMIAPVLLIAMFGVFAVGKYYFDRDRVRDAMRFASRDALVGEAFTQSEIKDTFVSRLKASGIDPSNITVTLKSDAGGDMAEVRLPWSAKLRIPMMDLMNLDQTFIVDIPLPKKI